MALWLRYNWNVYLSTCPYWTRHVVIRAVVIYAPYGHGQNVNVSGNNRKECKTLNRTYFCSQQTIFQNLMIRPRVNFKSGRRSDCFLKQSFPTARFQISTRADHTNSKRRRRQTVDWIPPEMTLLGHDRERISRRLPSENRHFNSICFNVTSGRTVGYDSAQLSYGCVMCVVRKSFGTQPRTNRRLLSKKKNNNNKPTVAAHTGRPFDRTASRVHRGPFFSSDTRRR